MCSKLNWDADFDHQLSPRDVVVYQVSLQNFGVPSALEI